MPTLTHAGYTRHVYTMDNAFARAVAEVKRREGKG